MHYLLTLFCGVLLTYDDIKCKNYCSLEDGHELCFSLLFSPFEPNQM